MSDATILVVEDETIVAKDIQCTLARLGYRAPATATSGEDALRKAAEIRPDLVLMDIGLPGLNGYDTARLVRANGHHNLHLVALTGYGQPSDRQSALEAGFDDHLVKPFNPADLMRILSQKQKQRSPVTPRIC